MQRYFHSLTLVLIALHLVAAHGEVVYKNTEGSGSIDYSGGQRGQTAILGGTGRVLTKFSFAYSARLNSTNVAARIRFFEGDSNRWSNVPGGPDRLVYESDPIFLPLQPVDAESIMTIDVTAFNLRVSDRLTWS